MENFAAYTNWARQHPGTAVRFNLNGDLRKAFHAMVVADVLAYGPSSLPALAAWYNMGKHYKIVQGKGQPAIDVHGAVNIRAEQIEMMCFNQHP
eukprot:SAG22_NODE_8404_length_659_cov_0.742857_2_plen_94_part_00